jgi:hypothetical protein
MLKVNFHKINIYILTLFAILMLDACSKDDPTWNLKKTLAKVQVNNVSEIKPTSASVKSKVVHNGGAPILEKGVCFGLTVQPTVDNATKILSIENENDYTVQIQNLTPSTKYFIRAYVLNEIGISYSNDTSFTTSSCTPSIATSQISLITSNSVYSGGDNIISNTLVVSAKGVVWSTSPNPTIALSTKTSQGTGSNGFVSFISGLTPKTTYYLRAYVTTSCNTSYGNEFTFTTLPCEPTLSTNSITNITSTSANSGGFNLASGNVNITTKGVVWSTSPNPTILLSTKTSNGSGTGSFSSSLSGLTPNTKYYVRAYATNSCGTSYGNEVSFVTSFCNPQITTSNITNITTNSASSGGTNIADGGFNITSKGVVWSTSSSPTISLSTKTNNGSGVGSFSSNMTGLSPNTLYYVRAYATNSCGTVYGSQITFTTSSNTLFTGTITLGSGSSSETTTGNPTVTPFGTLYTDNRHVYLFRASEITNLGGKSGNIGSISFNIVNRANINVNNFSIKLGTTSLTDFAISNPTLNYINTYNYSSFNLSTLSTGWVEFPFNSSFFWNGSGNIFIEVCFDNSNYTQNTTVQYSQTTFNSNLLSFKDNASGCSLNWEYYSNFRPNIRLNFK